MKQSFSKVVMLQPSIKTEGSFLYAKLSRSIECSFADRLNVASVRIFEAAGHVPILYLLGKPFYFRRV